MGSEFGGVSGSESDGGLFVRPDAYASRFFDLASMRLRRASARSIAPFAPKEMSAASRSRGF